MTCLWWYPSVFAHGITRRMENEDLEHVRICVLLAGQYRWASAFHHQLIEDKMNLEHDIEEVGVQMILLVEDSIRFYSSILPNLYKFVLKQRYGVCYQRPNAIKIPYMRGRQKIVLARNYGSHRTL